MLGANKVNLIKEITVLYLGGAKQLRAKAHIFSLPSFPRPFSLKPDGDNVAVAVQRFRDNSAFAKRPNARGNTSMSCKL